MLDQYLARLASAGPDVSLENLEQHIWARVDELRRLRRVERVSSRVQWAALSATLIASTALGVAVAQPAPRPAMQISLAAAALAPSTLLGLAH